MLYIYVELCVISVPVRLGVELGARAGLAELVLPTGCQPTRGLVIGSQRGSGWDTWQVRCASKAAMRMEDLVVVNSRIGES